MTYPCYVDELTFTAEAAHRLPHLEGKCVSLHGHSWMVTVGIGIAELHNGIGVEFGAFKSGMTRWLATELDHATLLGADDPLVTLLAQVPEIRVFRFGAGDTAQGEEKLAADLLYPTVEHIAAVLGRVAQRMLEACDRAPGSWVHSVAVRETAANTVRLRLPNPADAAAGELPGERAS